jgi:tetrapyrrole methylase family protein/MazG family protein
VITLLGLGPGDPRQLTREAWEILSESKTVHLRTRRHPTVAGLPPHLAQVDFDGFYEAGDAFEAVYARIVDAVMDAAKQGDVVYAVPGHPLVGEATTPLILQRAAEAGMKTRIVAGLSFIEPALEILSEEFLMLNSDAATHQPIHNSKLKIHNSIDPVNGLQLCDALEMASLHHPPVNPDKPALIAQVYSRAIASDVKLTLMNQYPPAHEVFVVRAVAEDGGVRRRGDGAKRKTKSSPHPLTPSPSHPSTSSGQARVIKTPLHELDHRDIFDHLTSLYVPALDQAGGFEALQETIAHLRAPEGCPWDREQTHASLRTTLLEEAYEVLTAIDEDDMDALKEELGDLLLNVVLQAQIATEAEEFRMSDVIAAINAKLIRRHPHVFGHEVVNDSGQVVASWNEIKKKEKADKGVKDASVLDGIAPALPALAQAQKMAHRAERAGFKWDSHEARLAKVREEIEEIVMATSDAHRAEEFGDLCFTIADWADGYGIDIETAAREANLKFSRRFRKLETIVRRRGLDLNAMSQADMLQIWREVKRREKR